MTEFVRAHPCEVFSGDGRFHSRYASMLCAALTVLNGDTGKGYVVDVTPGALDAVWDFGRCLKEVAAKRWVSYSRDQMEGARAWLA